MDAFNNVLATTFDLDPARLSAVPTDLVVESLTASSNKAVTGTLCAVALCVVSSCGVAPDSEV
jgi:hypothetical protein